MASINQGDDAVERLDNAVTAFEQIMTGPEGQTVAVPGHQPQPTLAERVKQNLKPSTDAAAGFAAQASASAKAADDAAKLASQISGLETVADAIGMAALPLPDVWAPLTDSLRLFTGYGREVKVGEDVIARMVNFSRSTTKTYQGKDGLQKTVAINEAAFGSGGCLVDGQSTNLVPWPSGYNGETPAWSAMNYSMSKRHDGVLITPAGGVEDKSVSLGLNLFPDLPNRPLSMTVEVKGNGYDMIVLGFRATYVSASDNGIGVSLLDGTVKQTNHGLTVTRFEPLPDGFVRITVSTPSYTSGEGAWRSAIVGCGSMSAPYKAYSAHDADGFKGVIVRNIQLEALPFASSYIPTAGAAATRAADAIQIPYAGNGVPLSDMQMTMSAVIKANPRPGEPTALIDAMDITPNVGVFLSATGQIDTLIFDVQWNTGITPDMTKEQVVALSFNGATGAAAMRVGDKVVTGTVVVPKGVSRSAGNIGLLCRSGTNTRTGFGSVRDFKIWHKFFTVDQLKAIK